MSKALILQLAQELIDDIIDYVFTLGGGHRSMKACALTCKAFHPRSQMHIFSTIKLSSDIGSQGHRNKRIKEFLDILHCSVDIVSYVRAVHLGIWSHDSDWIAEDPLFRKVMALLHESGCRPGELSIEGLDPFIPQAFPNTPHHPTSFNDNILYPFLAPFITSLRLSTVNNVPPTVIVSCINLTRLKLICTDLNTIDGPILEKHPISPYPRIETLEFDRPTGIMKIILDTFADTTALVDLSRLRVLHSTINLQNAAYITKIIKASADYLEEVRLCCSSEYGTFYYAEEDEVISPFDFGCVPRLRILSINMAVETTPSFRTAHKILENIVTILTSIPSANIFERLNFCAYLDMGEFKSFFGDDSCWELLDSEVIRVSSGKPFNIGFALHVLSSLSYSQGNPDETSMFALKELVEKCLPQSKRLSNVTLKVHTYLEHSI